MARGDLMKYMSARWDVNAKVSSYVEAVHRLNDVGAVVSHAEHVTTKEGFDAEWRGVDILMVEGDLGKRAELFDEADIDTAIARFEELQLRPHRLENAASQAYERTQATWPPRTGLPWRKHWPMTSMRMTADRSWGQASEKVEMH